MRSRDLRWLGVAIIIAWAFVSFVFWVDEALGQEPGAMLDAEQDSQDARLRDVEDVNSAQGQYLIDVQKGLSDVLTAIEELQSETAALSDRVLALEEAGPVEPDPPDPHPAPGPDPSPDKVFPNTDDGLPLMQANPAWAIWSPETEPFLDFIKATGGWHAVGKGKDNIEFAALMEEGHIDPVTLLPTSIPEGYDAVQSGRVRDSATDYPDLYAGTYCIDWEGDVDVKFGLGLHTYQKKDGENRLCADIPATEKRPFTVRIERLNDLKSIRCYRAEDEEKLNAGKTWNPKFIDAHKGYKILRDLDIQYVPNSWRTGAKATPYESFVWSLRSNIGPDDKVPNGPPLQGVFDLANETDTALWHVMPPTLGADSVKLFEFDALPGGWRPRTEALQAYARANAVEIADSPKWKAYADGLVSAMIASGYPKNKRLYVELGNEVWNNAPPFGTYTKYYVSLAEGLEDAGRLDASGHDMRKSYGFLSAQMATYIDQALREQGRGDQPVTFVLASQNAWVSRTEDAIKGFIQYFEWKGEDSGPWLKRAGVSTASYFEHAYSFDLSRGLFPAASERERDQLWLDAINSDPDGTAALLTKRIINGDDGLSIKDVIAHRTAQQGAAERFGVRFIGDYEGHDHFSPPKSLQAYPEFVNWFEHWRAGPEGGKITRAWLEALIEQNPEAVVSNYSTVSTRDVEGDSPDDTHLAAPWIDGFYAEESERVKVFNEYLRK